jgi:hypothetical protein
MCCGREAIGVGGKKKGRRDNARNGDMNKG